MATKKETTDAGVVGSLQRLQGKLDANSADLAHLEVPRAQLRAMLTRFDELSKQQGAMRAGKQEASKEIRALIADGQRLGSGLRAMVKIHYGPRSEKLTEFDLQPFRGRKAKAPAATPAPTPTPTSTTPGTSAPTPQSTAPPPQAAAKD
jgi:hypothetical protein